MSTRFIGGGAPSRGWRHLFRYGIQNQHSLWPSSHPLPGEWAVPGNKKGSEAAVTTLRALVAVVEFLLDTWHVRREDEETA